MATRADSEPLMSFHIDQPVHLEADEMQGSYSDEHFMATGSATLRQENLILNADSIWFNKQKEEAGAQGRVTLLEKGGRLTGDELLLNLATGQARLQNARVHLSEEGFNLSGDSIERLDTINYRITDGNFTVCTATPPAWKFGASTVDVEVGGYAKAKHMIFYLHDLPVLYLPYFLYPVKTERESGLLIPHFGLSSLRGAETYLSYYQVLGRNMDATLLLDTYSRAGIGKGAEYRYIFGEENQGETFFYHVSGFDEQDDLYAGRWKHSGVLPGGVSLRTNLEYVSEQSYLQNFAIEAKDYNRELVESYLSLSRSWGKTDLSIQSDYFSDLSTATAAYPLSRLPSLRLAVMPQRIAASPLYLRLDAQANHLQQGKETIGQTLLLRPAARLEITPFPGINLNLESGYRSVLSRSADDSGQSGFLDFSGRLGTRLQRSFDRKDGRERLRHDIEPEIGYLHIGDGGQQDLNVLLPESSFLPTDQIIVSLTNRLTTRRSDEEGNPLRDENLWIRLSSGYSFSSDTTAPETYLPLRSELSLNLSEWLTLRSDASYSLKEGDHGWTSALAGLQFRDQRRNEMKIDYYYHDGDIANYLSGRLLIPLTDEIRLGYDARYSADARLFLEHRAEVEYRGECWSVILTYRDRPDDQALLVNFTLAGLMEQGMR